MTAQELLDILFPPGSPKQLTPNQADILQHPGGPAWVLAGPGSGKTEVLTLLVLRLIYVDDDPVQPARVPPESIIVTTFTDKAARNLRDRITDYRQRLIAHDPGLAGIDVSRLRVGTLHGLCNDILQEFRDPAYQNVRLMDEFEQSMFVYEQMDLIAQSNPQREHDFWSQFPYLFWQRRGGPSWDPTWSYPPAKWTATAALVTLLNRIVEDRADLTAMQAAGGHWQEAALCYQEYLTKLTANYRCDFAHLQRKFLEFLGTPLGQHLRDGSSVDGSPGIQWVLVDEYQDTNLVQEAIYLALAGRAPHNLVVVGDDDQALYRFRGGSVECMVTFDQACHAYLGSTVAVTTYPMVANFRSHPGIVAFCNDYVNAFPAMQHPQARVPNKPALVASGSIQGGWPAVGELSGSTADVAARRFAETVRDLVQSQVISDPSQCCLLLTSTRESPHNAEKYVNALRDLGLQPYNPRNKAFLNQESVAALLGAISMIADPEGRSIPRKNGNSQRPDQLALLIDGARATYDSIAADPANDPLVQYVARCRQDFINKPGAYLTASLQEMVYYLLSLPPFDGWQQDPEERVRLGRITGLVEAYTSMPVPGRPNVSKGNLRVSQTFPGEIVEGWCRSFYYLFFGYLSRGGMDDHEDDEIICPPGRVPIMTMHQAKGLQFPFVFVGHANADAKVSAAHRLEADLMQFPGNPNRVFNLLPEQVRADLDLIRQFYVAYSRAQYALIIVGAKNQLTAGRIPCGPHATWLRQQVLSL